MPKCPVLKSIAGPWLRAMGQRIQAKRREVGMTQEKLAELTDLDPRTIQKIEAGNITALVTTVQRLRKALGCRYDDLLPD